MTAHKSEWPDALTPELREILGHICFELGSLAHAYRDAGLFVGADGEQLRSRAEDEQAFMLHRFLTHWFKAGPDWRKSCWKEMEPVIETARAARASKAQAQAQV